MRCRSKSRPSGAPCDGVRERVLVVDPDQKAWEASGPPVDRPGLRGSPHQPDRGGPAHWPRHLYDLVVVAAEDPPNREAVEFCQKLTQAHPPVRVALLAAAAPAPIHRPHR